MADIAPLRVQLIAKTEFSAPPDVPWSTDADGGPALVEFAGRACYQSWSKPNPRTATNASYVRHIIDVGHFSVLEHASVSFYITGISRSCTHELIRHRHFSYSQLSQRYVPEHDSQVVAPPGIEDDPELLELMYSRKHDPDIDAELATAAEHAMGCFVQLVADAQRRGEIVEGVPEAVTLAAAAGIHGLAALATNGSLRPEAVLAGLEHHIHLMLYGLKPR